MHLREAYINCQCLLTWITGSQVCGETLWYASTVHCCFYCRAYTRSCYLEKGKICIVRAWTNVNDFVHIGFTKPWTGVQFTGCWVLRQAVYPKESTSIPVVKRRYICLTQEVFRFLSQLCIVIAKKDLVNKNT